MSQETTNLKLKTYDNVGDKEVHYIDYRTAQSGISNSNMTKIDDAYGELKQDIQNIDVSEQIETHNTSDTSHVDIRNLISNIDVSGQVDVGIGNHNTNELSHPSLIQQLNEVATDLLGLNDKVIVESGSNSNGSYIKFGDGTMVCYLKTLLLGVEITKQETTQGLTVYSRLYTWTFPSTFVGDVSVVPAPLQNLKETIITCQIASNNISASIYINSLTTYTSYAVGRMSLMAIGRWK